MLKQRESSDSTSKELPSGPSRWPRDATVLMLALVNLLDELFCEIDERQKRLQALSELLTKELQEPYSASRIEGKIARLWEAYGHNDPGSSVDNVYNYGVQWATLPRLECKGEATSQEIQEKIEALGSKPVHMFPEMVQIEQR